MWRDKMTTLRVLKYVVVSTFVAGLTWICWEDTPVAGIIAITASALVFLADKVGLPWASSDKEVYKRRQAFATGYWLGKR